MSSAGPLPRINSFKQSIRRFNRTTTFSKTAKIKRNASILLTAASPIVAIALFTSTIPVLAATLISGLIGTLGSLSYNYYAYGSVKGRDQAIAAIGKKLEDGTSFKQLTKAIKDNNLSPLKQALLLRKLIGNEETTSIDFRQEGYKDYVNMVNQLVPNIDTAISEQGRVRSRIEQWLLNRQLKKVMLDLESTIREFNNISTSPYKDPGYTKIYDFLIPFLCFIGPPGSLSTRIYSAIGAIAGIKTFRHVNNKTDDKNVQNSNIWGYFLRLPSLAALTSLSVKGIIVEMKKIDLLSEKAKLVNEALRAGKNLAFRNSAEGENYAQEVKSRIHEIDNSIYNLTDIKLFVGLTLLLLAGEWAFRHLKTEASAQRIYHLADKEDGIEELVGAIHKEKLSPTKQALLLRKIIQIGDPEFATDLADELLPDIEANFQGRSIQRWLLNRQLKKIGVEKA
jgi:hypothetical protein